MSQSQENILTERRTNGRTDGRMDKPYFIGPFWPRPGVQYVEKAIKKAKRGRNRRRNCLEKCFHPFKYVMDHTNDCNWTRTQNHLVLKQTLNHLPVWSNG